MGSSEDWLDVEVGSKEGGGESRAQQTICETKSSRGVADGEQMQITRQVPISQRIGKRGTRSTLRHVGKVNRDGSPCAITGGFQGSKHFLLWKRNTVHACIL
jgi:hypothetical protein